MKRFIVFVTIIVASLNVNAQEYIKSDTTSDGIRNVEAMPSIFSHQSEQYLLAWNYVNAENRNVDNYYLSVFCSDQAGPWNVSAGDKMYLGLIMEDEYIELTALMDAAPEAYETTNGTKYRTLAYYMISKEDYGKLYKGFDRFKIDVKVNNTVPITLAVKLPFTAIEHMLMSYLDIMIATGR